MMEPVARIDAEALKELEKHPGASATVWSGKASHRFAKDATPLVRLSDAEARIAELKAENERLKDRLNEVSHQREDVKWTALTHGLNKMSAEARAEAAEALLKEARDSIQKLCDKAEDQADHLLEKWTSDLGATAETRAAGIAANNIGDFRAEIEVMLMRLEKKL